MKLNFLIITLLFFFSTSNGQTQPDDILMPSPKAASLMRFGAYPVSLHTGLVDITIPIYTIDTKWMKVPIEFKYHASGIKYDDVSMEVGLGWTLNAGGMVFRSVRGAADGMYPEFVRDAETLKISPNDGNNPNSSLHYEDLQMVEMGAFGGFFRGGAYTYAERGIYYAGMGRKDGEVDMYSYSFLNNTGNFCFPFYDTMTEGSPNYSSSEGLFIPINGMKALPPTNDELRIIDTNGTYYYFEVKDRNYYDRQEEYHLTKIVSADKADTITFTYETGKAPLDNYISRPMLTFNVLESQSTGGLYGGVNRTTITKNGSMDIQSYCPPRLKRIDFRGGAVEFEYRMEIEGRDILDWDLRNIYIINDQKKVLRTISLSKSKFLNKEDRLDAVIFSSADNSEKYDYKFEYNGEPGSSRTSPGFCGIDYWGYYNQQKMGYPYYIPKSAYTDITPQLKEYAIDRESNEKMMQGGILRKITYPTKGATEFTYEAHRWFTDRNDIPSICGGVRIKEIRNYLESGVLAERKWYKYGYSQEDDGRGIKKRYLNSSEFSTHQVHLYIELYRDDFDKARPQYRFSHDAKLTTNLSMSKRSQTILGSSVVYPLVVEYIGDDNTDFEKTTYIFDIIDNEELPSEGKTYRWNSPDVPLRDNSWRSGKLHSKTIHKKEGDKYKEVYYLKNHYEDINMSAYRNLRVLPYAMFMYYSNDGTSVSTSYVPDHLKTLWESHIFKGYYSNSANGTPYNYFNYYTTTGVRVLSSTLEIEDGVAKETQYSYNKYGQPTQIIEQQSQNYCKKTEYEYPTDNFSNPYLAAMVDRNIINPLCAKREYRFDKELLVQNIISTYSAEYSNSVSVNNNLFALRSTESRIPFRQGADALALKTYYHRYDKHRNPIHVTTEDGTNWVYLWSYNWLYPVIQIQNVTYQEVVNALGESAITSLGANKTPGLDLIKSLADKLDNSARYVSYFTYEPLVGIRSHTEPSGKTTYYNYDGFGNLTRIVDDSGNSVESYEYNYK